MEQKNNLRQLHILQYLYKLTDEDHPATTADITDYLDKLKELQGILDEYEPTKAFDEDLFHQIIEKAVVMSKSEIAFHLIGGLKLTETIA